MQVVGIGSPAWRKQIAQRTGLEPAPALEPLGRPFVCSWLLLVAAAGHQVLVACSRRMTLGS